MKQILTTLFILILAFDVQAGAPFRGQPMMAAAYEKLEAVLRKLERADAQGGEAPLEAAALDLAVAKQSLENAKKNKGASRSAAIKLIDETVLLVEARPVADENLKLAKEKTMQAMDRVLQGVQVGR